MDEDSPEHLLEGRSLLFRGLPKHLTAPSKTEIKRDLREMERQVEVFGLGRQKVEEDEKSEVVKQTSKTNSNLIHNMEGLRLKLCNPLIAGDDFVQKCQVKYELPSIALHLRTAAKKKRWRQWERNRSIMKKDIDSRENENIGMRHEQFLAWESQAMERALFARLAKHLCVLVAGARRKRRLAEALVDSLETDLVEEDRKNTATSKKSLGLTGTIPKIRQAVNAKLFDVFESASVGIDTNENTSESRDSSMISQGRENEIEAIASEAKGLAQFWREPANIAVKAEELKLRESNAQPFLKAIETHSGLWDEELDGIENVNDLLLSAKSGDKTNTMNFFYSGDDDEEDDGNLRPHLESRHASSHVDGAARQRVDDAALQPSHAFLSFAHRTQESNERQHQSSRHSWVFEYTPEELLEKCIEGPAHEQAKLTALFGELSPANSFTQKESKPPQDTHIDQRVWLEGAVPWRSADLSASLEREQKAVDALEAAIAAKQTQAFLSTNELSSAITQATLNRNNVTAIYRQIDLYRGLCHDERRARGDALPRFRRRKRAKKNDTVQEQNHAISQAERERHHRVCAPVNF